MPLHKGRPWVRRLWVSSFLCLSAFGSQNYYLGYSQKCVQKMCYYLKERLRNDHYCVWQTKENASYLTCCSFKLTISYMRKASGEKGKAGNVCPDWICWCGEALDRLTRGRVSYVIDWEVYAFDFFWLALRWRWGQRLGNMSVINQVLAIWSWLL